MVKFPLVGGLDLTTVKPLAKAGTLRECLNFEVSTVDGYSRIAGIARFDGSEDVGSFKLWRLKYTLPDTPVPFVPGERAWFDPALKGVVLDYATVGGTGIVYLLVPGKAPAPGLPATLTGEGGQTANVLARDAIFRGVGEQGVFNRAAATIASEQRARVGQVPGRAGSDIIGGFWFKDRLYAIRDLPRIGFQNGYYTDADEGRYIAIDGQSYKILDVRLTGDRQGIITYDTAPGTGPAAQPIGTPELASLPVTGTLDDGYTTIPYADGMTVSGGISPYTWSVAGEEGTSVNAIEAPDANAINFLPQLTNAALYRSGASGWERVDLGREMPFRGGTPKLANFVRSSTLEGVTASVTPQQYGSQGRVDAAATGAMGVNDGTSAPLGSNNTTFEVSGFDFSAIPDNATITGIVVTVRRYSNTGAGAVDQVVDLLGVPSGTDNKAQGVVWPSALAQVTYGGESDLWGSQQITPAVLKTVQFGVRVISKRADPAVAHTGGIDGITVAVHFVQKDASVYAWNGSSDVPMIMRHAQVLDGASSISTLSGYLTIDCPVNSAKARPVNEGDQIRSAPNGGGDLLAVVAGRDRPIFMSGQAELDNNRARYQFDISNYFGQDEYEAVYGVSGAGPAFCFDGVRCIRIRTQLPAGLDLPRHIARHGDMLALGYFPGAVVFSKVGDPFETRGAEGAVSVELGDRLTGLAPTAGDALICVCQSSTHLIRGLVPESFFRSPISLKRGGIEYTGVDLGKFMLCDGLGVFMADTPESFGAASRNYVSQPVHPWLAPRLQAQLNSESSFLRPVASLALRNKNQMRLFFWDGWVLTMTASEPPQFTTQRYFKPAANEHSEPTPWVPRMLCSGIDSSGRERLFVSFYGGVKEGHVFEMDAGRSFDDEPIPAHFVLNPVTIEGSSIEKRHDRFFVYGSGYGVATVSASRAVNDSETYTGTTSATLGSARETAKLSRHQFRGAVDAPVEAFDISLRFDSNSSSEGEFALQYIELAANSRGQSRGR